MAPGDEVGAVLVLVGRIRLSREVDLEHEGGVTAAPRTLEVDVLHSALLGGGVPPILVPIDEALSGKDLQGLVAVRPKGYG